MTRRLALPAVASLLSALCLAGCDGDAQGRNTDPGQVDSTRAPQLGACRVLTADDVAQPSNATRTVDCSDDHTAETFAVGTMPEKYADAGWDDPELGAWAYGTCEKAFEKFLGADDSMAMRTILSWAWFRPSEEAWADGARWYRCDVVGGGEQTPSYRNLPQTAKGLLLEKETDTWMVCARGATVASATRVPCSEPHTWRAATTIKLGEPGDDYPGDRVAEVRTRDFCSDSVGAWLGYPVDYDFGYTWFHEGEWEAGNRRSICWARTDQ